MTVRESEPRFSLRGVHLVVFGVITQRGFLAKVRFIFGKIGVSPVMSVLRLVNTKHFHFRMGNESILLDYVTDVVPVLMSVQLTPLHLSEQRLASQN